MDEKMRDLQRQEELSAKDNQKFIETSSYMKNQMEFMRSQSNFMDNVTQSFSCVPTLVD